MKILWELFLIFCTRIWRPDFWRRLCHASVLQKEIVEKSERGAIERGADGLFASSSQCTPGIIAINTATLSATGEGILADCGHAGRHCPF